MAPCRHLTEGDQMKVRFSMPARTRSALAVTALVCAGGVVVSPPASARPLDTGHFHDVSTDTFDCDGTPTQVDSDARVNFTFVQRGPGQTYYRESVRGKNVFTNLDNGGTYTEYFTFNSRDHRITDNGDGTLTILTQGSGSDRYYDTHGTLVLNDPGQVRFQFLVDEMGTPDDRFDDEEIDGTFEIVRASTGRNDTQGRDFCADLVTFTS
jgi:hypothetical protein